MKLKYIIYLWEDFPNEIGRTDGYNAVCFEDLRDIENVRITSVERDPIPKLLSLILFILRKLPISSKLWYPLFLTKKNRESICFLLIQLPAAHYLHWLKMKHPNARFVVFLRDLYSTKRPLVDYYKKDKLVDYWITYDKNDAQKYGMYFYPEIESKINLPMLNIPFKYDVFFIGRAKNRIDEIIKAYDILTNANLRCLFYIVGSNKDIDNNREGIIFSNSLLSYKDSLVMIAQSKCILEINQEGAVGNTARFLEAVMYNKKLLTNNFSIKESKFYNPSYISIFKNIEYIDANFVKNENIVDYQYNNEFSPLWLLDYVDELIS